MKKNLKIMSLLGIIAFLSFTIFVSNIFDDLEPNFKNRLENSGFWDLTSTPIHINNLNPSINWSKTAADNDWCSGSGTWNDPYLIENITVDGLFSGSCIWIENSEVPFIIRNCTFINNGRGAMWPDSGILFNNVSNGYIENNTISLNEFQGILILDGSKNNTITNNIINNNDYNGLYLRDSSDNNSIIENTFNYNDDGGFYIYHSNFNNFTGNSITQSGGNTREISITGKNNTFSGNVFENCGIYLQPWSEPLSELSSHLIDTTNIINGRPIYYYAKKQFLTKDDFTNAGQIILVDCEYCEISGVNISNGGRGILFYYGHNNTIFNNSISNSFAEEILVYKSDQNNISHNLISNIGNSRGIALSYSSENNVSLNQIFDCSTAIDITTGYWNTISDNNLTDSYRGIDIYNGELTNMSNIIRKNIISDNNDGIYVQNALTRGNTIFLNSFTKNIRHAYDNGDYNYWDNGSLGNYWDDYLGNDTNDDGIGETPHILPGAGGNQDNFPLWDDGHNGSKILIDDSSSNNWKWASKFTWCTGSGTWQDPYIIKNCNIDGNNSGSCIYIKNSNVFFRIENCTVYNSESRNGIWHGGILLEDTTKGTIINSDCSNNNGDGISLDGANNITIKGCFINDNNNYGITQIWSSYNISIINNTINNNNRGIFTSSAAQNDKIIGNVFNGNSEAAIYFNPGSYSLIKRNTITGGFRGIHLWGNNNTILYNDIYSNSYGIYFSPGMDTWNNSIAHNTIFDSFSYGIYLEDSNDRYNTFYNNTLTGNGNNAYDNGFSNYWDNGIIGNYWDDYGGEDADDDGIGEDPYIITGDANSQDNFPIWDDGHNGSKIFIDNSASNNWNWAKTRTWCSGSGTFNDPYVIKDCTINGNNLISCITIKNSDVYFRIENCIVFNSLSGLDNAGIKLINVSNGQLVNNDCSNNNGNGLFLDQSYNNTISRNTASFNTFAGLYLWRSNNTEVIGNIFNGNLYSIYESESESNSFNWNVNNGFITSLIIDDTGAGDFTWVESVNQLAWIYGSGTLIDPYIIELITIDGLNLTSCLTIRNSNVYFKIQNCTFYNSGYNLYDGGIKLISTSNGELIYNNCSFNNANGIILDSCQYINISSSSINHNGLHGILLIDSNYIHIMDNVETINYNDEYGIYLIRSHNNEITGNTINNNRVGIYLDQSNSNFIDWNNLMGNGRAIVDNGENNIIGANNVLPSVPSEFPIEILLIILIVGIVVIGVIGAVVIVKKRISIPAKKEKVISEKKREKVRRKLEEKLAFVDYLIKENKIKLAYKNLGKIKDTADVYEFFDIFNKANEKVEICKEKDAGIAGRAIEEEERKVKAVVPVIAKVEEKKFNLFISYSTVDRDYFQIKKVVKELKKYPKINQISYWERDSKANIVEFMDETLEVSNTFILFCSEHSLKSKAVKDEWQAAFQMRKEGLIKLIPVFEEQKHIPKILWHLLNVKYSKAGFKGFIENLYKEIMRD